MIAVVIPSYRVAGQILDVIARIGPECARIYVVDDRCPDGTADLVERTCRDPRVVVLRHPENRGVGGATITGYRQALADGAEIVVKLDGDGQMDPAQIPRLAAPITRGDADYTKGNRFYDLAGLRSMPTARLIGNAALSFLSKLSSGYWNLFDPTNGFTAIHAKVLAALPLEKISARWFFESDLLFRLGILRAAVLDIPMRAEYGSESSSLHAGRVVVEFAWKHFRNCTKRLFYSYFLRDFSIASVQLVAGPVLVALGAWIGGTHWIESGRSGAVASAGTVMLSALPIVVGAQLVLSFLSYDMSNSPSRSLHPRL